MNLRKALPEKERKGLDALLEKSKVGETIVFQALYAFATEVKRLYYCNYEVERYDMVVAQFYKILLVQERGRG